MPEYPQKRYEPPPGALDLLLVRHGASAPYTGESFDLMDGHGDPPLSPEGAEQAVLVGARLAASDPPIDAVYVTTLRRTSETAAPLLASLPGMSASVEPGLREVYLGAWEGGLLREKFAHGDPVALEVMAQQRWDVIPGAEPSAAFASRVTAAIDGMAARHPGQTVVAFTHGGVIAEVLRQASGARPFAFSGADNASISQIVVTGDRWIVRRFNDTVHLSPRFAVESEPLT